MIMSEFLQLGALAILPFAIFVIGLAAFGPVMGIGLGMLVLSVEIWFIGREMNLEKQRTAAEAEYRAQMTGWSAEEREHLEG